MLYYQIPFCVCYITKFPDERYKNQIPSAYVILPNSLSVYYITKFPQRMLYYQIPFSVFYIIKFPQRMLYYQILSAYVI